MRSRRNSVLLVLAAVVLVAAIVGGQAVTDASATGAVTGTGVTVGRAAFSFLAGIRAFTAYALWNRLEPQLHGYYEDTTFKGQTFSVPTMSIVIALKPDFTPPYYILPWLLIDNGKKDAGLAVAREGVANNPTSGLLRISYAQVLALKFDDWEAAAAQVDAAMRSDTYWADDNERWDSLRIGESIYQHIGETAKVKAVAAVLDAIDKAGLTPAPDSLGQSHDHNGDGLPDH